MVILKLREERYEGIMIRNRVVVQLIELIELLEVQQFLRNVAPIYNQKFYNNYHMTIVMFHAYRINYSRIRYAVHALQVILVAYAYCAYRNCFNSVTFHVSRYAYVTCMCNVSLQPLCDCITGRFMCNVSKLRVPQMFHHLLQL